MKILYVVNNAAFFHSHRLPIALAARERGHEVALLTGAAGSPTLEVPALASLAELGIPHVLARFRGSSTSLTREALGLLDIWRCMRTMQPDLVHCASPKGVLYGGLAARLAGVPAVVLSISGMGSMFTGARGRRRLLRWPYLRLLRAVLAHRRCHVIVQNADDRALLLEAGLLDGNRLSLIPGSGVPTAELAALPLDGREPLVVLPARMLLDKGVLEFVEAARRLGGRGWRFALVGTADYDNPTSVGPPQIRAWVDEGVVEWWGHRDDMHEVYARASIVCLPSHREGMPKSLLEAAAAGCAVVTTDAIGCREAIVPGQTGDLVPVGDAAALAETLGLLMADAARLRRYGEAGRARALERFDLRVVVDTTLGLYDRLVPGPSPGFGARPAVTGSPAAAPAGEAP